MKELLIKILNAFGLAWWVEIITDTPSCTYYFGPFLNQKEAKLAEAGYLEDLQNEGAQGIKITLKRCKPNTLTIFDELSDLTPVARITSFRNQFS